MTLAESVPHPCRNGGVQYLVQFCTSTCCCCCLMLQPLTEPERTSRTAVKYCCTSRKVLYSTNALAEQRRAQTIITCIYYDVQYCRYSLCFWYSTRYSNTNLRSTFFFACTKDSYEVSTSCSIGTLFWQLEMNCSCFLRVLLSLLTNCLSPRISSRFALFFPHQVYAVVMYTSL